MKKPPQIHTISYDEKPGIQAIATVAPDLPPKEGKGFIQRDSEYTRLGTVSAFYRLFAKLLAEL